MKIFILLKKYSSLMVIISGAIFYGVSVCLLEEKSSRYICLQTDQIELISKIRKVQQQKIETQKIKEQFQKAQKEGFLKTTTVQNLKTILEKLLRHSMVTNLVYEVKSPKQKQIQRMLTFWYKITLDIEHPQDQEIFKFIEQLSHHFPGIVLPEQILLTRVNDTSVQNAQSSVVSGKYLFYVVTFEDIPALSP